VSMPTFEYLVANQDPETQVWKVGEEELCADSELQGALNELGKQRFRMVGFAWRRIVMERVKLPEQEPEKPKKRYFGDTGE
jgi:hypothetical protein